MNESGNPLRDRFTRIRELAKVPDKNNYEFLIESPQRSREIDVTDFDDISKNHDFSDMMKRICNNRSSGEFDGYSIFSFLSNGYYHDAFIKKHHMSAFFRYKKNEDRMEEDKVWQDVLKRGFCRKIIFEYYLKKFNEIMSDGLLSELGEHYWKKLIEEALKLKFKVSVVCGNETDVIRKVEDSYTYFGTTSEYREAKILISK